MITTEELKHSLNKSQGDLLAATQAGDPKKMKAIRARMLADEQELAARRRARRAARGNCRPEGAIWIIPGKRRKRSRPVVK